MFNGFRVINIDESSITNTIGKSRSWSVKNQDFFFERNQTLSSFNIIAGVSNKGEAFFTMNMGRTTSKTFYWYLLKLVECLDQEDSHWRKSTILLLDNASYHRSTFIMDKYKLLRLPICFLGPYDFKLAPVEKFFRCIKARDSNPQDLRIHNM